MHRLFSAAIFGATPIPYPCRGVARRGWILTALLGLACAALPCVRAANVGNTIWEDADPDATARAVQIHLIRLASANPQQIEQAQLGLESLGLNALAPLQAALAEPDRPAAEKEKIQALVDRLLESTVITLKDPGGQPLAHTVFEIVLLRQHAYMVDPVPAAGPEIRTLRKFVRRFAATTDARGRLVVPGITPPDPNLNIPHIADEGALIQLIRRDWQPVDGFDGSKVLWLFNKKSRAILAFDATLPTGVTPAIHVTDDRHRPVVGATVLFIPVDETTWQHSRLSDRPFAFNPATGVSDPEQLRLLAQSRLWNPLSALYLHFGCCSPLTDQQGELQVGRIAPGKYALQILAPGYQRLAVPEFVVPETVAADAEPTVFKLETAPGSFCAGTLQTADHQPLKGALAYLLPADQIYDPEHILELRDLENRRAAQRRADALRAGKNPAELPPPEGKNIPAYTAANVPLDYIQELTAYPQMRVARSQASGRIEFKDLAAGKYVLRIFRAPPEDEDPAHAVEWVPVAADHAPPTLTAKDGGPIDLTTLQYEQSPPAPPAPPMQKQSP